MARIITICNAKGGVGKCVAPGTPVLLASGKLVPIEELFELNLASGAIPELDEEGGIFINPPGSIKILSLDEKLKIIESPVTHLYRGRSEQLYEVVTARGKNVQVTPKHPFLVLREGLPVWIQASDLEKNDFVATPRNLPTAASFDLDLIKYLPPEIYLKINDQRMVKTNWRDIVRLSQNNLEERILARLAQSSATSLELYKLGRKVAVFVNIKKLLYSRLIFREREGRVYRYRINPPSVITRLYESGFSAAAFRELNFQTKVIAKMFYRTRLKHECPVINPITKIDEELACFLALVIAKGYIGPSRIVFYNSSKLLIRMFETYCQKVGLNYSESKKENQWVVRVNKAGSLMKILHGVFDIPIRGLRKSFRVKVPSLILKSPNHILAAYLGMYIDGEGHISKNRSTVEIVSASRENITNLNYSFLRFGILSSIKSTVKWATNSPLPKKRIYYRLTITGAKDLRLLKEQIPINIPQKARRLKRACQFENNTNVDVIPVAPMLRRARQFLGFSQGQVGLQGTITDYEDGSSAPSRNALSQILSLMGESSAFTLKNNDINTLVQLNSSDIFWDKIKKIKKFNYNGYVYDLSVANTHNFVAGNGAFIIHNTTTATSLSAYLAAMGKYVLIVDLDPQANATSGLGIQLDVDHPHIYNAICGEMPTGSILHKTALFGFDILPAGPSLAGANVELISIDNREYRLKQILNSIRTSYDYIVLDSAPSLGLLTINGLAAAEEVIIPVQCEYYALEGLSNLLQTIDLVRESLNPSLKVAGVLLTMYDKRNCLARQVVKEVQANFPGRVFETIIPRSISLAEAPSFGKTILQFDPDSKAGRAYRQLAEEVIKIT